MRHHPHPRGSDWANGPIPVVPADPGRWRCRHALLPWSQGRDLPAPPPCPASGHAHSGSSESFRFLAQGVLRKSWLLFYCHCCIFQHLTVLGSSSAALSVSLSETISPPVRDRSISAFQDYVKYCVKMPNAKQTNKQDWRGACSSRRPRFHFQYPH